MKVSAEIYKERIGHVYAVAASVRSAKECERLAEVRRLIEARDSLCRSDLSRRNAELSERCGKAIATANSAIREVLA